MSEDGKTQFVIKCVQCPFCRKTAKYRISVRGANAAAKSLWNTGCMAVIELFGPFLLAILLLENGWKVLVLAILGAIVAPMIDWVLSTLLSFLIKVPGIVIKLISHSFNRQDLQSEIFVIRFTVVLKCPNTECNNPKTSKEFQVKLSLPIKRLGCNYFDIAHVELVG